MQAVTIYFYCTGISLMKWARVKWSSREMKMGVNSGDGLVLGIFECSIINQIQKYPQRPAHHLQTFLPRIHKQKQALCLPIVLGVCLKCADISQLLYCLLAAIIQQHTFYTVSYSNIIMKTLTLFFFALLTLHIVAQQAEDAQYLQMRRTACVILSRMHSNQEKATIEEVIQGLQPNDQQRYINKLYAVAVQKCQGEITQQQVQSFYVESQDFNPASLFPLLDGMNYRQVVNDLTTTKEQDQITRYIKKFDEQNQIREEERQAKKQQETGAEQRYEMKLLGISIKDLSSGAKLTYVAIFAVLVIGALYYGLSNLDEKKEKTGNKRRSPKKDKAKAA